MAEEPADSDRLRRWRLVLGGEAAASTGMALGGDDVGRDRCLAALYDGDGSRRGGLAGSNPKVVRWLGDIRGYFPTQVVQVMQQDALDRLGLRRMLLEPELLAAVEPDVHLVAALVALKDAIPARTRETARAVVRQVTDELLRRLRNPLRQAVAGSVNRAQRSRRPRSAEIDWPATIRRNLHQYLPDRRTIVPEHLVGHGRRRSRVQEVILCVDQSASMATSVVYGSVFASVLAGLPALRTSLVVFDTSVVDLSEALADPVEVLFGTQLGGGTDIGRAVGYCQGLVRQPEETTLVLISDLYDGGDSRRTQRQIAALVAAGVRVIVLLTLSQDGAPTYDHAHAAALAALGVPVFACTPDVFPEMMAAALNRRDVGQWAASQGIP